MNYEKGEKLKDINELLDIMREGKPYFCGVNLCYLEDRENYYCIDGNDWQHCNHAISKTEKKKYYKAWYKMQNNCWIDIAPSHFEDLSDLKLWIHRNVNDDFEDYGLITDEFIEV